MDRVQIDSLPAELRENGLFCCWLYEERDGNPTKPPFNPRTGQYARSNDPASFAPLPVALEALERGCPDGRPYMGIGVGVFGNLAAIDIDHCVSDDGELSEMALDIMNTLNAYTEYSPSGKGLRILFTVPVGFSYDKERYYIKHPDPKVGLEIYIAGSTKKYVTVTGDPLSACVGLVERGDEPLRPLLERYMVRPRAQKPTPAAAPRSAEPLELEWDDEIKIGGSGPVDLDDAALIEKIKQSKDGPRFSALWAGDITGYNGDDSRADLALCNIFAWWTNCDADRIDRLFRQSGLYRPEKWDRREDYRKLTIEKAIANTQGGYNPEEYRRQQSAARDFAPVAVNGAWEPPIPFDEINTPDFPVEALPKPLDGFVECLAEDTQTSEEMAGTLSLGVLSTGFQSKYIAAVTPTWRERLCLYSLPVAPPGERKSGVLSQLCGPIYEYEAMRRNFEAAEIAQNQTERRILEKKLQEAQQAASKGKDNSSAKHDEALALAAELAEFKDKHQYRLIVDDTTPEKLIDLMEQQGGSLTVCSSEGGLFDALRKGRYDQAPAFDIYLKGHDGESVKVDRIGRASNYIPDARLTMILTIQPEILQGLMKDSTMRGRGFCGRFLYAVCKSKMGSRDVSPPPVPESVREEYRRFVHRILSHQGGGVIRLSPEADEIRKSYQAHVERKLGSGGEWEHMRDWAGKLTGTTVRIAALIHAATVQGDPAELPVSPEIMEAATKLGAFFAAHAEAAYQIMGADDSTEDAKYLLKRIQQIGGSEMKKRDLFKKCQSRFKRMENMEPAIQVLTERGYIREADQQTGGRPSAVLAINPLILSA